MEFVVLFGGGDGGELLFVHCGRKGGFTFHVVINRIGSFLSVRLLVVAFQAQRKVSDSDFTLNKVSIREF
jgi:hypothetical protein